MELNECLFKAIKTLGSILPVNLAWCRIANVELTAISCRRHMRLAKYQVVYWDSEPNENSVADAKLLRLALDGDVIETFYTDLPDEATTLKDIEQACVADFLNLKAKGLGYVEMGRVVDMVRVSQQRIIGYMVTSVDSSGDQQQLVIDQMRHVTSIKSESSVSELRVVEAQALLVVNNSTLAVDAPYRGNKVWMKDSVSSLIAPSTLKHIRNIRVERTA